MREPSPEQLEAVRQFAAENGRTWKERLRDAWLRADARIGGEPSHLLQQVRNQFGPSWLDGYTLPTEARYDPRPPTESIALRVQPMIRKYPKRNC